MNNTDAATEIAELLTRLSRLLAPAAPAAREDRRVLVDRVLLKPEEAAERLGIGRTTVYALLRTGEIESVRVGRLRRVPVTAVQAYAARLIAQQAA